MKDEMFPGKSSQKTEYDAKDLIRRSTKTKSGVFNKRMSDVTDQYIERTRQVVEQ